MSTPSDPHTRHLWEFQWVRDLLVISAAGFVLWLGHRLAAITVPLLVALALAYCCEPLVRRLTAWFPRLGRTGSAVSILVGFALTVGTVLLVAVVPLVEQATAFAHNAPRHLEQAKAYLTHADRPAFIRDRATVLISTLSESKDATDTSEAPTPAISNEGKAPSIIARLANAGLSLVSGVTSTVFGFFLFLAVFIFSFVPLSASFPAVAHWLQNLLPSRTRKKSLPLLQRMDAIISGFVRGRLITAGILALVYALGWSICGVPYAIVLGLCIGMASLVPYLAVIGLPIAWSLLAVSAIGASEAGFYVDVVDGTADPIWWKILVFPALVNSVAQSLEDYVLTPLIQGQATQLHPVAIMLAIIAGGSLAGLYGMILAVPVAACAKVMLSEVIGPRLRQWAEGAAGPSTISMQAPPPQ